METLRILWFNWRDIRHPEMGGAEVFTHEVAKRLVEIGHEVTLFTSRFKNAEPRETVDGVEVMRDGGKYTVYMAARKMYKEKFRGKYEVLVDEINTRPFLTPGFANNGEKIIALIHQLAREGWFYETPFPMNVIGYYLLEERWLRNYLDIPTITVSESTKQDLIALGFKKINVVPEGLNFEPLYNIPRKEERPTLIFAGRMKKYKRPHLAVEAFKLVRKKISEAQLWMVGDGYLKRKIERKAPSGVKFFGDLSNEERRELVKRAWVLVNPSVREGFGLNVIEANALGVPCVAYDVCGLRDSIRNGETGLLVKSCDTQALAEGLFKVLEDEGLRRRLSEDALEYSRNFSWDRTAGEFMKIVKEILGR